MKAVIKKLYYAYGSNMNQERLERRVGPVTKLGPVTLPLWEIDFNCGPAAKRFANIVMTGESKSFVEGVLYEMTAKQMRILDNFEGCPYFYQKLAIPLNDGRTMFAYVSFNPFYRSAPEVQAEPEYMEHLIKGCEENRFHRTLKKLRLLEKEGMFTLP